jgi:Ca2+-binding RTX toxin-like protein
MSNLYFNYHVNYLGFANNGYDSLQTLQRTVEDMDGTRVIQNTWNYIVGTSGDDVIDAPQYHQVMGYDGNDTIHAKHWWINYDNGDSGSLLGGSGADTFVLYETSDQLANLDFASIDFDGANYTPGVGIDAHIGDFEIGVDKIDLSNTNVTSFDQLDRNFFYTHGVDPNEVNILAYEGISYSASFTSTEDGFTFGIVSLNDLRTLSASDFIFASSGDSDSTSSTGGGTFTIPNFTAPDLNAAFTVTGETLTATGSAQASLRGGTSSDSVTAAEGNDEVYGAGGSDKVSAGAGNDLVYGGSGVISPDDTSDTVIGGAGEDVMYGNGGDDVMIGDAGLTDAEGDAKDVMVGGAGNDILYGNGGGDFLYGLIGNDTLVGGSGDDLFVFDYGNGNDLVMDFDSKGNDLIAFNAGIFTDVNHILSSITYANGAAYIDMQGQGSVVLANVTEGMIGADDFTFFPGLGLV